MSSFKAHQWNPEQYAKNARFVSDLGMPVVELLAPQPGESILDLGCGDGALSIKLAASGCKLVAVDSSPEMVAATKALGLDAKVMDGQSLEFCNEFDAVFSNAALHWMKAPEKVISGVWQALKPGGRFVAECGGYGNVASIVNAIETALASHYGKIVTSPWYFPSAEEYKSLLEANGFKVNSISLTPRPTLLPGDIREWLKTFAQNFITALPTTQRKRFITDVVEMLSPVLSDENGNWIADYVRLRFSATRIPVNPVN